MSSLPVEPLLGQLELTSMLGCLLGFLVIFSLLALVRWARHLQDVNQDLYLGNDSAAEGQIVKPKPPYIKVGSGVEEKLRKFGGFAGLGISRRALWNRQQRTSIGLIHSLHSDPLGRSCPFPQKAI